MAKLIAVIGNVGVGKTTFARQLCAATGYMPAVERHDDRVFHAAFATNGEASGLANQVDYLLLRAEQEQQIRAGTTVGVMDGGLEQDFLVFTRYFRQTGLLSQAEFDLCHRLYQLVRRVLPPPDLIIALDAPVSVLVDRYSARSRATEVIKLTDIPALVPVVAACLATLRGTPIVKVNAAVNDPDFVATVAELCQPIRALLDD